VFIMCPLARISTDIPQVSFLCVPLKCCHRKMSVWSPQCWRRHAVLRELTATNLPCPSPPLLCHTYDQVLTFRRGCCGTFCTAPANRASSGNGAIVGSCTISWNQLHSTVSTLRSVHSTFLKSGPIYIIYTYIYIYIYIHICIYTYKYVY